MKNIEILNALAACDELSGTKMPFGAAMAIRRLFRELSAISEDIEAERKKLLAEYAKQDENGDILTEGDTVVFTDQDGFVNAYNQLLVTDTKVDSRVQASLFEGTEVEPRLLIMLGDALEG